MIRIAEKAGAPGMSRAVTLFSVLAVTALSKNILDHLKGRAAAKELRPLPESRAPPGVFD